MSECWILNCNGPVLARGMCQKHYSRWHRYGDPHALRKLPNGTLRAWIKQHVSYDGAGCLVWPFSLNGDGRPQMSNAVPCRLMCELVKGPPPTAKHEAAHSCGKGHEACIHPKHLYWATHAENTADKQRHGTIRRGERSPTARLTPDQVRQIKALSGTVPRFRIAQQFDVSDSCVWAIVSGRNWRHII